MWTLMDSPIGELRIVEQDGAITAIEFSPLRDHDGRPRGDRSDASPVLVETVRQLRAYFDRDLKEFDLPLAPAGSDFQKSVWAQLLLIGYGDTASYGEIAKRLGRTNAASRAVGAKENALDADLPDASDDLIRLLRPFSKTGDAGDVEIDVSHSAIAFRNRFYKY